MQGVFRLWGLQGSAALALHLGKGDFVKLFAIHVLDPNLARRFPLIVQVINNLIWLVTQDLNDLSVWGLCLHIPSHYEPPYMLCGKQLNRQLVIKRDSREMVPHC